MKKKIFIGIGSIVFLAVLLLNVVIVNNSKSSSDISVKSLLLSALAEESETCVCEVYDYDNKLLEVKTCVLIWKQKLTCTYDAPGKCCKASDQKVCTGELKIPITLGCTLEL